MPTNFNVPTRPAMSDLLTRLLPGKSEAVHYLREQVLDFCSSLTAQSLLLRGPIGAGKSTIARVVGLLKRVAPLKVEEADRLLRDARFEGHNRIDLRYMPWYVELALTGLVESLADVQLFGVAKGAYTGATAQRTGVFEQASTGRSHKGKEHDAARLTGGVVFLDEIGDLSQALQAKLLPVLSGGAFYRVGGEGDSEHELQFRGTIVTASWRRLDRGLLRPDLLSRVSGYVIDVPSLVDRMEDFDDLLDGIQDSVITSITSAIDHATKVEPGLDREFWLTRRESIMRIDKPARCALAQVDWSRHGNMRGLSIAVQHMIAYGRPHDDVIAALPVVEVDHDGTAFDGLLTPILQLEATGKSIVGQVRTLEAKLRRQLRAQLMSDRPLRKRLAQRMNITEQQLIAQLRDLARIRRKADGAKE